MVKKEQYTTETANLLVKKPKSVSLNQQTWKWWKWMTKKEQEEESSEQS
ncbi:MAG: hypothetical protein HXS48_10540 [Theionarchaea archaeon]|nr:hypothetical protein [Theionarchaea archaeon]